MSKDLTHTILQSLKGCLGTTVSVPHIAGKLVVQGASRNPIEFGWKDMPEEMRVERTVYCCLPAWDMTGRPIFVFEDDVTVVDAPAILVIDQMMERMHEVGVDDEEIDRFIHGGEEGE